MKWNMLRRVFIAILVMVGAAASAQDQAIRTERVRFQAGKTAATIKGRIVGYESVSYLVGARADQTMTIALKPSNSATYFNVYAPGKRPGDEALANSEITGPMVPDMNRFSGKLPSSGDYIVSVYMVRAAARRNERSSYTLDVSITAADQPAAPVPAKDALVPGTNFHATGKIPCARSQGQPMASCDFGVVRRGAGAGTVTVFWPDGGNRVILFDKGKPSSFDRSQADGDTRMRVSRKSDLFTVTIGPQRFEIPEAVITGG